MTGRTDTRLPAAAGETDPSPGQVITPNQAVAWNVSFYRKAAGLTQEELGGRLGWSGPVVSAAERSWVSARIRQFTADDMAAIAVALGIPVLALLIPPPGMTVQPLPLFTAADPGTPTAAAYRQRVQAAGDGMSAEALAGGAAARIRDYRRQCGASLVFMLENLLQGARHLESGGCGGVRPQTSAPPG